MVGMVGVEVGEVVGLRGWGLEVEVAIVAAAAMGAMVVVVVAAAVVVSRRGRHPTLCTVCRVPQPKV